MSPSNHFIQPGISSAQCPYELKEPSFFQHLCVELHLWGFGGLFLVYPVHIGGVIHAQAGSGVVLQEQTCSRSSTQSVHILFPSPNRATLRGGFSRAKGCSNPGAHRARGSAGPADGAFRVREGKGKWGCLWCGSLSACRCGFSTTASRDRSRVELRRHSNHRDARRSQPGNVNK